MRQTDKSQSSNNTKTKPIKKVKEEVKVDKVAEFCKLMDGIYGKK